MTPAEYDRSATQAINAGEDYVHRLAAVGVIIAAVMALVAQNPDVLVGGMALTLGVAAGSALTARAARERATRITRTWCAELASTHLEHDQLVPYRAKDAA